MKKLFILLMVCSLTGNAAAAILTHLEFEGNILDSTGNITYIGTPGSYVPGPAGFGQAMDFEADNGNVLYAEGIGAKLSSLTNQMTIAFWQYGETDLSNPTNLFSANDPVNWSRISIQLPWNNEYVFFDTWGSGGAMDRIAKYAGDDPTQYNGQWNHWAFVKNTTLDDSSPENSSCLLYTSPSPRDSA